MNAVTFTALPGLPEIRAGHDSARVIVDAWPAPETHAAALLRPKEKDLFQ